MTEPLPPGSGSSRAPKLTAAMIAIAVAAAAPFAQPLVTKWESGGRVITVPYRDIVGKWTVCDGETRVAMRRYTPAECAAMTERAVKEFGTAILQPDCTPIIYDRPRVLGAAIVISYNIGTSAYCHSSMARYFNAGAFVAGCHAFRLWNRAGGVAVNGLTRRRADETELCLEGAG